jgi:cytochrome P450
VAYHAFTLELVQLRRRSPREDLLSWIIQDSDGSDDPLTEDQLASLATSLLTAGHETTTYWLTMSLHRLLSDRAQWAKVVESPSQMGNALEELLRIDGPVQSVWRTAKVATELGGASIPAGARVSVVLGSANLDDEVFERPDAFDPTRSNVTRHLTFGRGPHTCVGANIARLEGRITLETLAARLPDLRLVDDGGLVFVPNATQRIAQHLNVEW